MRILAILGAFVAAFLINFVDIRSIHAEEGPWCAAIYEDGELLMENCGMRSFEMCREEISVGGRGRCYENPYYRPAQRPASQRAKKRDRR